MWQGFEQISRDLDEILAASIQNLRRVTTAPETPQAGTASVVARRGRWQPQGGGAFMRQLRNQNLDMAGGTSVRTDLDIGFVMFRCCPATNGGVD